MVQEIFFIGALEISSFFIGMFILYYAIQFFRKSHGHRHRRPWEYLGFAIMLFIIFSFLGLLEILTELTFHGIRELLLTCFAGLILLTFTHQHHLIHHHDDGIHIHKKPHHKRKKKQS